MALADRPTMVSYAQNGEDVVLERVFVDVEEGFYVDIGACDPVEDSVTFHFYDRGWRGVNVEPDQDDFERLTAARARDISLQVAVGSGDASLVFYPSAVRGHGTVDKELATERDNGRGVEVRQVSLARIFDEHAPPAGVDFLKVDAEGWEADVLASADWTRHRPRVVVVEAVDLQGRPSHDDWEPPLIAADYRFALFDGLNRFYCRAEDADWMLERLGAPANVLDNWVPARQMNLLGDLAALETERAVTHAALLREQKATADAVRGLADARRRLADTGQALADTGRALADTRQALAVELAEHEATERLLTSVYDSTSWRMTSAVRDASRLARLMRRGGCAA